MPISVGRMFDVNAEKNRIFDITLADGTIEQVDVTYYPNRITLEGDVGEDPVDEAGKQLDADEIAQLAVARRFCRLVKAWDVTGPWTNAKGQTVVEAGAPFPLVPDLIRLLPTNLIRQINIAIYTLEQGGNETSRQRQ